MQKSSLDQKFIEKQKAKLIAEKELIEKELSLFAKKDPNIKGNYETVFPQIGDDSDENASEVANYINTLGVEYSLEDRLVKINKALKRIAESQYGICSNCGEVIPKKRLEVYPEADLCIKCGAKSDVKID